MARPRGCWLPPLLHAELPVRLTRLLQHRLPDLASNHHHNRCVGKPHTQSLHPCLVGRGAPALAMEYVAFGEGPGPRWSNRTWPTFGFCYWITSSAVANSVSGMVR